MLECATLLSEERLLAKLSGGDLIALEANYHSKCLSMLYRKAQHVKEEKEESEQPHHRLDGITLAELVSYIEEFATSNAELPIFKLTDLANMYKSCLQRLGCDTTARVNALFSKFLDFSVTIKGVACTWPSEIMLDLQCIKRMNKTVMKRRCTLQRLRQLSVKICSLVNTRFQDHLSLTVRLNPSQHQCCLSLK